MAERRIEALRVAGRQHAHRLRAQRAVWLLLAAGMLAALLAAPPLSADPERSAGATPADDVDETVGGELTLGWDGPLPTQELEGFLFRADAVGPCATWPTFWEYLAPWAGPDRTNRAPFDDNNSDHHDILKRDPRIPASLLDFANVHLANLGCDARSSWQLPASPPQGLERPGEAFTVSTSRDAPASPTLPLAFTEPDPDDHVVDVEWTMVKLDDNPPDDEAPTPGDDAILQARRSWVSFTTRSASTGLAITLTTPSGFGFSGNPTDHIVEVDGTEVDVVGVTRVLPHVATIAVDEEAAIAAGARVAVQSGLTGVAPEAAYADTNFTVRTQADPAEASPPRGITVRDELDPGDAVSVGNVSLSVADREAGSDTTWTVAFRPVSGLRSFDDEIVFEAPSGTVLPDGSDPRAYTLNNAPLEFVSRSNLHGPVRLRVIGDVPALNPVELRIDGVRNPSAGTYAHEDFVLHTTRDTNRAHPDAPQSFGAAGIDPARQVEVRPADATAGALTDWTASFRVGSFGLGSNDAITLAAPVGTVLPADYRRYTVNGTRMDEADGADPSDLTRIELHRVQLIVPERVEPGQLVDVVIEGVVNPGAQPLPSSPVPIDSSSVEIPVECVFDWDAPDLYPSRNPGPRPVEFWEGSLANAPFGYGGNYLACEVEIEERQPDGSWMAVPGTRTFMRTDRETSGVVRELVPFTLAADQFVADVRMRYSYWLAHEGSHPLVSTSQDPDPASPASSMAGFEFDFEVDAVEDVWLARRQPGGNDRWHISFRPTAGGGLAADSDTIRLEGPPGFVWPDPASGDYLINDNDFVEEGELLDGGRVVELTVPVSLPGGALVTVEVQEIRPLALEHLDAFTWDEPLGCAGVRASVGHPNPSPRTENPREQCLGIDRALETTSTTSPATLMLQPTAILQASVMPYKILYQPPGDSSEASFELAAGFSRSTEFGVGHSSETARARNVYTSMEHGGRIGASPGVVSSISNTQFLDTTTSQAEASATERTNSVSYEHVFTQRWATSAKPELGQPGAKPWEHNQFVLLVHPQFAMWNREGTSIYQMIGTQSSEWIVSARQLGRCAAGTPLPVPGDYYPSPDRQIVLQPDHCASLIALDPFAAAQRSSIDVADALGPLARRIQSLALGAPGDGTGATKELTITETEAESVSTDQTTTFTTQITEIAGNEWAVGAEAGLEFEVFGIGAEAVYTMESSWAESEIAEFTTSVSYRQSQTTARTVSESVSALLGDSSNPINTAVWLDQRWGTFAFTVPAPALTSAEPAVGGAGSLVTLQGHDFWSGPVWVEFCPAAGDCVAAEVVDPRSDQELVVLAPTLPHDTVADVIVHSPGGPSEPGVTFTYDPAAAPDAPVLDGIAPSAGAAGQTHRVTVTGSGFDAQPLAVLACVLDGSACTALPDVDVLGDGELAVTLPALAPGTVDLAVVGPGGQTGLAATFTYEAAPPAVTRVRPDSGPAAGGTLAVIEGSGFAGATAVRFGGARADFTVRGDGTIEACAPEAETLGATRRVHVTVETGHGTSAQVASSEFTYTATGDAVDCALSEAPAIPQVTGISPILGPTAGGTPLRVEGTGFALLPEEGTLADGTSATRFVPPTVYVGGARASDVRLVDEGALEVVTPPGSAGPADVRVAGADGTSPPVAAARFTYAPDAGCLRCGTVSVAATTADAVVLAATREHLVADGSDATGLVADVRDGDGRRLAGATVTFDGDGGTLADATVVTDRYGQARTTLAHASPATLRPRATANGASDDATVRFWAVPDVESVTPGVIDAAGGARVTVTGRRFTDADAVYVGSAVVRDGSDAWHGLDTSAETHEITITAPAGEGTVSVAVANPAVASFPDGAGTLAYTDVFLRSREPGLYRIGGVDRFDTAARLSVANAEPGVDVVYVATGTRFADALTGGVAAALDDAPVLLVSRDAVPAPTAAELERLDAGRIVVLGGEAAVSAEVAAMLADYTDGPVERLWGAERFATAAAVSRETFPEGADTVYIGTGLDFPDVLAGVPAAARGPLLLVAGASVPEATRAELERIDPDDIVVLGGEAAVSAAVADELATYGEVTRVAGADRYETAGEVAAFAFGDADAVHTVFVATGHTFPDALASGAIANAMPAPLLLTRAASVPEATMEQLERLAPDRIVIIGGEGAVSADVAEALEAFLAP